MFGSRTPNELKTFEALWGLRGKELNPRLSYRSHQRAIFFNMENNYVKQLEDALINAAVNKQLELERMGCASEWGYILALENLLINYKREYWIKRGIELFKDNIFNPF